MEDKKIDEKIEEGTAEETENGVEDIQEPEEADDRGYCKDCGTPISDATYEDNGGLCDKCAGKDIERTPEAIAAQKEAEEDEEKGETPKYSKAQLRMMMMNREEKRDMKFGKRHSKGLDGRGTKRATKKTKRTKAGRKTRQQQRSRKCA